MNTDIPDEVWDAAAEVLVDPIAPSQFKAIVQATTRAAQVAILREKAGQLRVWQSNGAMKHAYDVAAEFLLAEADELDAGGGQTETEVQGDDD